MSRWRRPFAGLLASVVMACDLLTPPPVCTLIACDHGLVVSLTAPPSGAFTVTILEGGVPVPDRTKTCDSAALCPKVLFEGYFGSNITIRVMSAAGTKDTPFSNITYTALYPNGTECGAACIQGNVTAAIP
jgi:hypothetical protein